VGRRLYAALGTEPKPPFLRARMDKWSIGDKVAWGELPLADYADTKLLATLTAALKPLDERCQLIHGDLTGNVLFADSLPPLVIDLSPYWRPPTFASAIVMADALAFEGASAVDVEPLMDDPDFPQYLLRGPIYHAVTDQLSDDNQRAADVEDTYRPAAEFALQLAAREPRPQRSSNAPRPSGQRRAAPA